jgi:AraC family transcriptional regulator
MLAQPPPSLPMGACPSSHLDVLSVTCPVGELETLQDSHHVLYFHVGRPVELTCRLDGGERNGGVHYPGNLCVLPAGVKGQWSMEARADSLVMRLSPLLVKETAQTLRLKSAQAAITPAMRIRDPHLEYISWVLRAEQEAGYPYGRIFVDSAAAAIAARLLRRHGYNTTGPRASRNQLPRWRLRTVCDYIEANLDRDFSLAELAGIAGFSVPHFKPLFRHAMGLPVHRYVVECRVERARRLLLQGDRSMGDIAIEAGFTHQSHMARCLRRVLGIGSADVAMLGRGKLGTQPSGRRIPRAA